MESLMIKQFGDDSMRQMMENLSRYFPDHPVAIGDTWQIKTDIGVPYPMSMDNRFTLRKLTDREAVIDGTSTIKPGPNAAEDGMEMMDGKLTMELTGEQSGQIIVDRKTGMILSSNVIQHITGTSTMTTQHSDDPMVIPMTIESKVIVKNAGQ